MTRFQQLSAWTVAVTALAVAVCAVVLRLTVRDRFHSLSTLFYATQPIVIAGLLAVAARCFWRLGRGRTAVALVLGVIVCMNWWHQTAWFHNDRPTLSFPDADKPLRLVFWNTCRGAGGWNAIADRLAETDADIIGMVESGEATPTLNSLWKTRLRGYHVESPGTGIRLASRYPIEILQHDRLAWGGDYAVFGVETPQGRMHVLIADVTSHFAVPRNVPLDHVLWVRDRLEPEPLVIMGDMNTTADSVFYHEWRKTLRNMFEECGDGCIATWPVPVPLFGLDQVWISKEIEPVDCRNVSTTLSDHRMVESSLRLRAAPH